jgi:cobalt-zinc-cadmium efflux system membrane fusion protein
VNNDELHADFMVFEKDINNISVGQKVFFTTSCLTQEFEAEIHNISPVFEEEPKALHVHAEIISDKTT